jgi:PleD family two-component response regulator
VSSQSAAPTQNSAIPAPVDAIPQESKKAKESDTASAEAAREASSQGSGQLRILLVEDCVSIQKLMSRWLRSKDCHVTIAANGKIGLQFLTSQRFDVAFMDFLMVSESVSQ